MHRIASLGDMQESNKHERHVEYGGARKHSSALYDSDDEQHLAMVDLGKVFEFVLKNTLAAAPSVETVQPAGRVEEWPSLLLRGMPTSPGSC